MAAVFYEEAAHDNTFYKFYPKQMRFVAREWRQFIPSARMSLVKLLEGPYSEDMKEEILEILLLDKSLPKGDGVNVLPPTGSYH